MGGCGCVWAAVGVCGCVWVCVGGKCGVGIVWCGGVYFGMVGWAWLWVWVWGDAVAWCMVRSWVW